MKVEAMEATRSPQGKLRVRFDNGESLLMLPAAIAQLGLYVGMQLPEGAMTSIRAACTEVSAKERAVRILSSATVSTRELKHRLIQKGEGEQAAQQAVQWLSDLKLLDDRRTAEQIVRSGAARGYGEARIRQMLYEKRIPKEYWQEALAQLSEPDEAIDRFLQRRFRGKAPDSDECRRAAQALLRRGHSWCDIRRALERYAPDEEDE